MSDTTNGLIPAYQYRKLASFSFAGGTAGKAIWIRIGEYEKASYYPIRIDMYCGNAGSQKTKYEALIGFNNSNDIITQGTISPYLGYVLNDDSITLYVKLQSGIGFNILVVGGSVVKSQYRYNDGVEPEGIVYFS